MTTPGTPAAPQNTEEQLIEHSFSFNCGEDDLPLDERTCFVCGKRLAYHGNDVADDPANQAILASLSESICDQIKSHWRDELTDDNGQDWNRGFNEALIVCADIVRQNDTLHSSSEAKRKEIP